MLDLQWGFGVLIGTTYSAIVNVAFFLLMGLGVRLETLVEVHHHPDSLVMAARRTMPLSLWQRIAMFPVRLTPRSA